VQSDAATLAILPDDARRLIDASITLYDRVARFEAGTDDDLPAASPARLLLSRLQQSF